MQNIILDVLDFHHVTNTDVATTPGPLSENRKKLRKSLIDEEVNKELLVAIDEDDIKGILDGAVDSIYVILGTLIEYGLAAHFKAAWNEVQRSNMSKVDPDIGVIYREDGKVLKPDSYSPADLDSVLNQVNEKLGSSHLINSTLPSGEFAVDKARYWLYEIMTSNDLLVSQLHFDVSKCKSWDDFKIALYDYQIKAWG